MSGQSEADFELGYNVNIFSHLNVLSVLAKHAESRPSGEPLPVHVNVSSLAVYGGPKAQPTSCVIPEYVPQACFIVRLLILDDPGTLRYSRKPVMVFASLSSS